MPTIIRKSHATIIEARREIYHAFNWHVRASVWGPPADIYETEEKFVVRIEIAGMKDEDFEIAVENNVLMVRGNRPDLNERRAYHQMEIRFGKFEIAVDIPIPVKFEDAVAGYKDGFLIIQLPKASLKTVKVE
jgi:HSP20 family protein